MPSHEGFGSGRDLDFDRTRSLLQQQESFLDFVKRKTTLAVCSWDFKHSGSSMFMLFLT